MAVDVVESVIAGIVVTLAIILLNHSVLFVQNGFTLQFYEILFHTNKEFPYRFLNVICDTMHK